MSITAVLAALVAAGLILIGAEQFGEHRGAALRAAKDQVVIDHTNAQLTEQKATAAKLMQNASDAVIAKQAADAKLTQLQSQLYAKDSAATERARVATAASRLRITIPAASAGCGSSGSGALSGASAPASAAGTVSIDLPATTAGDLRQLVLDADRLADAYRLAYRALYPDWKPPMVAPDQ